MPPLQTCYYVTVRAEPVVDELVNSISGQCLVVYLATIHEVTSRVLFVNIFNLSILFSNKMPTSCCVPGCKTNYDSRQPQFSVFQFPKEKAIRQKWISAICRTNFLPKRRSVVCIKHFDERFIIREDSFQRADGSVLTVKRSHVKLTKDAFPTKDLPEYEPREDPEYRLKQLPEPRKYPGAKRLEIVKQLDGRKFPHEGEDDPLNNFSDQKVIPVRSLTLIM